MRNLALILVTIILSASLSFGQASSGVTGVVTDAAGAVVPGVTVTLTDTKTGTSQTTTTTDNGNYIFNNIKPGAGFKLSFEKQGFQTFVLNDVQLGIAKTETQNAQLTAGQVTETVQVTSTTGDATLNTTDATLGNVIGQRQLRELPIQLRGSPAALIGLQPGAVGSNVFAGATGGNRTGSVTGSRADQGNITVDGIDANDQTTGQAFNTVANAPIDSIQEFRAVTSGFNAGQGRSSGGQIELTTNSGTNKFHGNLREYYRTEKTAANPFFNNATHVARPALRRHQFGGSLGGPLPFPNFGNHDAGDPFFQSGKDKLFFFVDAEIRRDRSQSVNSRTVPLQQLRDGQIGYIRATDINTGATCASNSRLNTTPGCIGFETPAQIQALDPLHIGINQALLSVINSRFPLPNDLTGGNGVTTGLFRFNSPNMRDDKIYTFRFDAVPNANNRVFVRTTITRRDSTNSLQFLPGDPDAVEFQDRSFAIAGGWNWIISSNWTNSLTVGLTKSANFFTPPDVPSFPNVYSGGPVGIGFPSPSYQDRQVYVPTFRDDMTLTHGKHTLQFGFSFKPIIQNSTLINDFNFTALGLGGRLTALTPAFRPSNIRGGSTASYDSAFAFLLGRIGSVSTNFNYDTAGNALAPGSGKIRSYAYNEFESYVQDNWKIRSDLTLNLGLRYYVYPAPYERNGLQADNTTDFQQLVALRAANAAAGIATPSSEPFLTYTLSGKANNGTPFYNTDWKNFAPRVGFAYNPAFKDGVLGGLFGERKTVLHGSFAEVFDRVGGGVTFIQNQLDYLFANQGSLTFGTAGNPTASFTNDPRFTTLPNLPVATVAPTITNPITPFVDGGVGFGLAEGDFNYTIDHNFKIPKSYTFNFGYQRELPWNLLLDVSYVGRLGRDLFVQADTAQVMNFKDPGSGQLLFDAFNALQPKVFDNLRNHPTIPAYTGVTSQPWIENQMALAGISSAACIHAGYANCTEAWVDSFPSEIAVGDTSDMIAGAYGSGFIRPNVGMSSQFGTNAVINNQGRSSYHGMLLSLQRRFSQGLEFDINYTYSKSLDNNSTVANTVTGGLVCDILNPGICKGPSDFDIRHLFNANFIYDLPFGRGRMFGGDINRWVDTFLGGWTISGIFSARSGLPFSPGTNVLAFPIGFNLASPAILTGDLSALQGSIHNTPQGIQFFADPTAAQAAIRYPHHGEIGSRNILRGPNFWGLDMGLAKKIAAPWNENQAFTLRVDAFNVTNTNAFGLPNVSLESTSFGIVNSSANTPRELQFGIRFDF